MKDLRHELLWGNQFCVTKDLRNEPESEIFGLNLKERIGFVFPH